MGRLSISATISELEVEFWKYCDNGVSWEKIIHYWFIYNYNFTQKDNTRVKFSQYSIYETLNTHVYIIQTFCSCDFSSSITLWWPFFLAMSIGVSLCTWVGVKQMNHFERMPVWWASYRLYVRHPRGLALGYRVRVWTLRIHGDGLSTFFPVVDYTQSNIAYQYKLSNSHNQSWRCQLHSIVEATLYQHVHDYLLHVGQTIPSIVTKTYQYTYA